MPRRTPIAVLLSAVAALAILAPPASAVTIHREITLHPVVGGIDPGPPVEVPKVIERVVRVPPGDADDDGCADPDDSYDGPGCEPPAPVVTVDSSGVASAGSGAGMAAGGAASSSGACGGITPYYGGGQCWAIPYDIVLCESGGSLTAQNPSGAYGAYQLLGHGEYEGMSKAEQDAMAADLWAGGAGVSNWVCAGG
jgi:hypothetical protein